MTHPEPLSHTIFAGTLIAGLIVAYFVLVA